MKINCTIVRVAYSCSIIIALYINNMLFSVSFYVFGLRGVLNKNNYTLCYMVVLIVL